jgi:hypothetical protein
VPAPAVKAGAARPDRGRFTLANYAEVRAGMTEAQVRALLGRPTRLQVLKGGGLFFLDPAKGLDPNKRILTWRRGRNKLVAHFVNDSLIMSAANFADDWGAGPGPPVTEANFNKLRHGMSVEELHRLLGPPSYINNLRIFDEDGVKGMTVFWKRGRDDIETRIVGDRLVEAAGHFAGRVRTLERPSNAPPWARTGHTHLSRALYDKLQPGTDMKDVILQVGFGDPLGPQAMPDGRRSELSIRYVEGTATMTLHFVDGKLAGKEAKNLPAR